jgi:hypothetical protein
VRRVILANDSTLRIVRVPGESGVFTFLDDLSAPQARRYLEDYAHDSLAMSHLRMALAEDSLGMPVNNFDDGEVLDEVAHRVEMGHLTIAEELEEPQPDIPEPEQASSSSAAPPPELPRSKKLTFVEFKVIWDISAEPVKNVRLVVKTPDGVENFHDTNGEGKARVEDIEAGSCDVRCDMKDLKLTDALGFVAMGDALAPGGTAPAGNSSTLRIVAIKEHKVKAGESIASLAIKAGMTWQNLAKFNWNTAVPDEINKHLMSDVGCTHKTKDGKNYMFDDTDDPGIVFIPSAWSEHGLASGSTHVIRVRRVSITRAPFIFSY